MKKVNFVGQGFSKTWSGYRYKILIIVTILGLIAGLTFPLLSARPAFAQSVAISASVGSPNSQITISGSGFTNGDTYQITFAPGTIYQVALASTTTISGSTFARVVTIPNAPSAQYTIQVTTNRGTFSLLFQVASEIVLNSYSGNVGDTLLVSGGGFRANVTVNIYFNNINVNNSSTDIDGILYPVSITVPAMHNGSYGVYATDGVITAPNVVFIINPNVVTNVTQGNVGDQVRIDGTGFNNSSGITVYWDNQVINAASIFSNSVGSFSTTFTVPATTGGSHTIRARDNSLGTDIVAFVVNPNITINPNVGTAGSIITITGNGFRASTSIALRYNAITLSTQPTTIFTDSSGSFSGSFTVPEVLAGSYTIIASDGTYTKSTIFIIASNIILNPSTGNVGTVILVNGSGFTPRGKVTLYYDDNVLMTVNSDSVGAFSVNFAAPISIFGQHTIKATDLSSSAIIATATYTMESTPPLTPSLLAPEYGTQTILQPLFSWSGVTDPSGVTYELQIAWDTGFAKLVMYKQGLISTQYQITESDQLELTKKSAPYYWRVRAIDGASNASGWTNPGTFYTEDSTPPAQPVTLGPQSQSQVGVTPVFTWSSVSDPSGVTYDLQIAWDTNFTQIVLLKQHLTQTQYQITQAEQLQLTKLSNPYYWRIRAVDGAGNASNWTTPGFIYTLDSTAPPVPTLLNPANGTKKGGAVYFNWSAVSDPSGVTYTLEVAQDSDFTRLVIYKEQLGDIEYKLTKTEELSPTTGDPASPYYWRVRAIDGAQNASNWSAINAFYVGGFWQLRGWLLYIICIIGGLLLLLGGVLLGMRLNILLRPKPPV
jgi:hypothetical protein